MGTHGRGAFVTDITPLQELTPEILSRDFFLFTPEAKGRRVESGWGNFRLFGWRQVTTPNEPNGAMLDIYQGRPGDQTLNLTISDGSGTKVRALEVAGGQGLHRVVWDLRDEERRPVEPGDYTVRLVVGDLMQSQVLTVKPPVVLPRG